MRHTVVLLATALVIVLAGCGDGDDDAIIDQEPVPTAPDAVELTTSGGCGDAFFWLATEDGTTALTVGVEVPRRSTREPVVVDVDLASTADEAVLLRGDGDLTRNLCVDVLDEEGEPTSEVEVAEGTGTVTIDPVPTDVSACGNVTGRIELEGVVAEDGTEIGSVSGETTDIGCFAG